MKKTFKGLVLLAMVGGWPLAISALHVVRTPGPTTVMGVTLPQWASWHLLTKDRLTFRETFVDTRAWTLNDVADHSGVAARLERAGLGSAFAHVGTSDEIADALKGVKKDAPAVPATEQPEPVKNTAVPARTALDLTPTTQPSAERKATVFDFGQ